MRLMIAGGGTGGHLFPGVAIAEELRAREPDADVVFVGTERGIEARVLPELGWDLELIEVSGIKTVGIKGAMRGMFSVPRAMWQSRRVLKMFKPDAVIGVGGYASGPVVLMARMMGIPTGILEQNSIPGLANKILGKFARAVFLAFDHTRQFFSAKKIHMTGNPIRKEILGQLTANAAPVANDGPINLFVFGGSQGAQGINELMPAALALVKTPFHVVHQTGGRDFDATVERYRAAGIDADCRAFIKDMASEYRRADLIIARSGATTVAELGIVGVPAILIPYPHAADNHQEINAKELVTAGAAQMFRQGDLTPESFATELDSLLSDRDALSRMGSAMNGLGKPGAAAQIVDWCEAQ